MLKKARRETRLPKGYPRPRVSVSPRPRVLLSPALRLSGSPARIETVPAVNCQGDLRCQKGVAFLWVAVGLFVLAVLLLFAAQPASIVAQRMKEKELLFRGREYTEGIRTYQLEHGGGFPTHLADLLKPGPKNKRYIRKLWRNPFDPDGQWGLLAPGTTVVTFDEDGKPHYNSQALPASGQNPTGSPISNQPAQLPGSVGGKQTQGVDEEGSKEGTGQQSGTGQKGANQQANYVLPFRLDGQDNQPIVGVWCKLHKKAFSEFLGKIYYDEWYFTPLVIPPLPPVTATPQPMPKPPQPQPQPQPKPSGF